MKLYLRKFSKIYLEIPRICPICNDFLFKNDESTVKKCTNCKMTFTFEIKSQWFKTKWIIDNVVIEDLK